MKKLLLSAIAVLLFAFTVNAVLVDGYCYLENQTNHEGTKVLFQADSPTAVTDSTYTNISGYYQINLSGGLYDVFFIHYSYFPDEILDQLLFSPTTLSEVTLSQAPSQISGPQSGILTGDHFYFVIDDISVESGDSLIIEAGATLIFSDGVNFDINGYIHAAGTETDSVKFINSPGLTWGGIDFNGSANDNSMLEYCLITGSSSIGIYCWYSSPAIDNCTISGNTAGSGAGGIGCVSSSPAISNCTISGNTAEYGGGIFCNDSSPSITNCAISGNTAYYGGGIYCYYSSPDITNTIVEGNFGSWGVYLYNSPSTTITYSDFHNNQNGNFYNPPQWVGTIVTVNANGDSCDTFMNIFMDPLFYSTTGDSAYYLTAESPCIDAGDPESPLDPDGTIADIGAYYFHQYFVLLNPFVLNFETVAVGENRTLPIWIINNSPASVIVNEIFAVNPVFYTDFTPVIEINSGDSIDVMVTFQPDSMLNYNETLWVYTSIDTLSADLLGEGTASLIESEPDTLSFLALELGMDSTLSVVFQNSGNDTMLFYQIISSDPVFSIDFPSIGDPILPGAFSDTCWVTFTPEEEILYEDSLFVLCNAFNTVNDTFIVYLRGEGGIIPDTVRNLTIESVYPNAVLNWDPVTASIYGSQITIDYYLVFFVESLSHPYNFLAYTQDTTYSHEGVVQFAPSMFYFVEAYVGDIGSLEAALAAGESFSRSEVYELLR